MTGVSFRSQGGDIWAIKWKVLLIVVSMGVRLCE